MLSGECERLDELVRSDPGLETGATALTWTGLVEVALPCLVAVETGPDGAAATR